MLFGNKEQVELSFKYLTSQRSNIKFTVEKEVDSTLNLFDIFISKKDDKTHTSVYRKPTYSGFGTHFFSYIFFIYKINSIKFFITYHSISAKTGRLFDKEIHVLYVLLKLLISPKFLLQECQTIPK